jgi:hypothetical protein
MISTAFVWYRKRRIIKDINADRDGGNVVVD